MSDESLEIGGYKVVFDREVTAAAYMVKEQRGALQCGCGNCQNWMKLPDGKFPLEFWNLLSLLGIDGNKENEVYEIYESSEGLHVYGGWFNFCGELVQRGEKHIALTESNFEYSFESGILSDMGFQVDVQRVAAVSFVGTFPWLLNSRGGWSDEEE